MTRLPTPGGDAGNWGSILNEYLSAVHNTDGSLKTGVVAGSNLASGSITTDKLADAAITPAKLASSVQTTLSSVVTTSTVGAAGGIASLDSSGKVPASQLPEASGGTTPAATASVSGTIRLTGDLGGSATSPSVVKLNGVSLTGTPSAGQALVATSSTAAGWQVVSGSTNPNAGTVWNTTSDPASGSSASSVREGDLWVDGASDPTKSILKARVNNQWVTTGEVTKPAPTTTTAPLASSTPPAVTDTAVTLHWTAPSQVAGTLNGYNVYEGSSTTPLNSSLIPAGTTSYTTTAALTPGTEYSFVIKAVSTPSGGSQTESAGLTISATTSGSVVVPLPAPTGVSATAGNAAATVSFSLVTGATSYTVTASPGSITKIGSTSPITVDGLANGTSYSFTVSATDGTRTSAESAPSGSVVPSGVTGGVDTTTFMTRQGDKLYLGNTQWRGTGINLPWSLGCAQEYKRPPTDAEITTMFQNAKPYSIYRFWAYANYSVAAVKHLMDLGRPFGHRFIPVLADGAAGCGDPYNPYPQNQFNDNFTSTWPNTSWKNNWLTPVINAFKNDPVIAWYEWMNEPINSQSTTNFYNGVGDYVRNTLGDTHLIGTGTMSIYQGDQNIRKALNSLSTVDVCSMHEYDGAQAASSHTPKDAACAAAAGKPFIVGEFGIKTSEVSNRANQIRTKIQAYKAYPTCAAVIYWSGQSPSATEWASYEISVTNSPEINVINTEPF